MQHDPAGEDWCTLVTPDWLSRHLNEPGLVVLDCSVHTEADEDVGFRNVSGRSDYDGGHIPSAGFADLTEDLADGASPIEFSVPTPGRFCSAMGALGVGDDSRVVLYDAMMPGWSARVWWMLRWVGFDRAAILDGGLPLWIAEGGSLSTESTSTPPPAIHLTAAPREALMADRDEVMAAIDDDAVSLVDAMPEEHYRGEQTLYGRAGHIPGASNISVLKLFDESGRYRPSDELAAMFQGDHNARVITYCGGGIAACAAAFAMARLGFTNVAVYTASLQEWTADPANPMSVSTA